MTTYTVTQTADGVGVREKIKCTCECHTNRSIMHFMPCCDNDGFKETYSEVFKILNPELLAGRETLVEGVDFQWDYAEAGTGQSKVARLLPVGEEEPVKDEGNIQYIKKVIEAHNQKLYNDIILKPALRKLFSDIKDNRLSDYSLQDAELPEFVDALMKDAYFLGVSHKQHLTTYLQNRIKELELAGNEELQLKEKTFGKSETRKISPFIQERIWELKQILKEVK